MNNDFMKALKFSEKDLEQNRAGRLSTNQKASIMRSARILGIVVTILALLLCGAVFFIGEGPPRKSQYLAIAAIFGILFSFSIFFYLKSKKRVHIGNVKKCSGTIGFKMFQSMQYIVVKEANVTFPLSISRSLIEADKRYNVYYLDSIMKVVSIEEA